MSRLSLRSLAAVTALTLFAGCATAGRDTAIGAGVGAGVGAGAGALIGGKKGALIGLGVGALAGGSVGLYLDKQRKDLEKVAEVKKTENGLLVQLAGDILFDSGSAVLKAEAVEQISKVGDIVAKYADDRVRIEGHTDSKGGVAHNTDLSDRRAKAVRRWLVERGGIDGARLEAVGRGPARPIDSNETKEGRARNRRVEFIIL